jgi:hypothetical protein
MSRVVKITTANPVDDQFGRHRTEWRFHLDDDRIVTADLTAFVQTEPDRWRYWLLTFASGATIERVEALGGLWIANGRMPFGTEAAAAEYAIGGGS